MKILGGTILWVVQIFIGVCSLTGTIYTFTAINRDLGSLGLEWEWWAVIGVCVLTATFLSAIVRLVLKIRGFNSEDAKLQRHKSELEVEELERKKLEREQPEACMH